MCNSLLVILSPSPALPLFHKARRLSASLHSVKGYAYNPAESGMPFTSIFFSGQKQQEKFSENMSKTARSVSRSYTLVFTEF